MTPAAIIASAWASERERYQIWSLSWCMDDDADDIALTKIGSPERLAVGTKAACQAHLDQLCAAAAERALKAAARKMADNPPDVLVNTYVGWLDKIDDRTDEENVSVLLGAMLAALEE